MHIAGVPNWLAWAGLLVSFVLLRRFWLIVHFPLFVDRRRRFSMAQYRQLMRRAGWRCEHSWFVLWRCPARTGLEADHFHPWIKGGATEVANGQALCHWHNTVKGAWVPSILSAWRLQFRRRRYFPEWADPHVVRRGAMENMKVQKKELRRRRRRWR